MSVCIAIVGLLILDVTFDRRRSVRRWTRAWVRRRMPERTRGLLYEVGTMTTDQPSAGRVPSGHTLHLVPEPVWRAHQGAATYTPEPFAEEGFVHCTDGD